MGGVDYKSVKFQVIKLMRMVVQICQTLSAVPNDVRPRCQKSLITFAFGV